MRILYNHRNNQKLNTKKSFGKVLYNTDVFCVAVYFSKTAQVTSYRPLSFFIVYEKKEYSAH